MDQEAEEHTDPREGDDRGTEGWHSAGAVDLGHREEVVQAAGDPAGAEAREEGSLMDVAAERTQHAEVQEAAGHVQQRYPSAGEAATRSS
jgi:hypothetical protein